MLNAFLPFVASSHVFTKRSFSLKLPNSHKASPLTLCKNKMSPILISLSRSHHQANCQGQACSQNPVIKTEGLLSSDPSPAAERAQLKSRATALGHRERKLSMFQVHASPTRRKPCHLFRRSQSRVAMSGALPPTSSLLSTASSAAVVNIFFINRFPVTAKEADILRHLAFQGTCLWGHRDDQDLTLFTGKGVRRVCQQMLLAQSTQPWASNRRSVLLNTNCEGASPEMTNPTRGHLPGSDK